MVLSSNFMNIGFPIIMLVVGLLIGGGLIYFVPFFKKQRANKNAKKIIRDARISASRIIFLAFLFALCFLKNGTK